MNSSNVIPSAAYADTKSHYEILDGLRGVAALMVIAFHLFEAHVSKSQDQIINHGYMAVDFFYVLSGFVIGYAYDDRWGKMTLKGFFKRRLIRLQPMIVIGMIIGAIFFYLQDCGLWPGISEVPVWKMLLIALIGCTLLPVPLSLDIRGWQEGWPLDGPAWSLFFEYIGNILYALFIRKFSNRLLSALVFVSGLALLHLCITKGDVIGGWTPLEASHLSIGFTRLMFPFFAGLLLSRICKPKNLKHSFLICSLLIIICLSVPRIGGDQIWMNGLYVAFCIIVLFPVIVYLGASGSVTGKRASRLCEFLGDISYPVYITHYPLIYIYTAWATDNQVKWQEGLPYMVLVMAASIAIAYGCLKLYDMPVRKWLTNRFM